MRYSLLIYTLLATTKIFSQNIAIGQWRSHQDFSKSIKIVQAGDTFYCSTSSGPFYVIRSNGITTPMSKVSGLSNIAMTSIGYSSKYHLVFMGYQNADFDIIHGNKITTVRDIERYTLLSGSKSLNGFYFNGRYCYIAGNFGIVQYDIERNEMGQTCDNIWPGQATPGPGGQIGVNSIAFLNDTIYAATNNGVICANLNSNLQDYNSWRISLAVPNCFSLQSFANKIWLGLNISSSPLHYFDNTAWKVFNDTSLHFVTGLETDLKNEHLVISSNHHVTLLDSSLVESIKPVYALDAILDEEQNVWLPASPYGILKYTAGGQNLFYKPNGPSSSANVMINSWHDEVYVASGGVDLHLNPLYNGSGVYVFKNGAWESQNPQSGSPWWKPSFKDVMSVAIDPISGHKFYTSFGSGMVEYEDVNGDQLLDTFGMYTSPLRPSADITDTIPLWHGSTNIKVGGASFDNDGNLWICNFLAKSPLIRRKNNKFYRYNVINQNEQKDFLTVTPDDFNQLWITRPFSGGIVVFNSSTGNTRVLSTVKGNGNLQDNAVNCILKDKQGQIWAGTNSGVSVFYNPSDPTQDSQPPWVNNGNQSGYLLNLQNVTCMSVDGADRKWIGTRRGVFVTSEDGTVILHNFTSKNSPLPSDNIQSIGVNGVSGEVFIGTDQGLISYRADATEATNDFSGVYAFPNPVRPGYTGPIAIKGLQDNTSVKITDVTGNMVWETTSHGGLVTWDGKNFSGQLANSGVYLIMLANSDGSQAKVTKLLIVR